jgi:hypothetical protein
MTVTCVLDVLTCIQGETFKGGVELDDWGGGKEEALRVQEGFWFEEFTGRLERRPATAFRGAIRPEWKPRS